QHADRLTELTGLPLDPYFAAPKMTWLRREAGEEGVITMVDAWLNWRLAGAFVTDAATASRALLMHLDTTTWSDEACALFGIDPDSQPQIVDCAAPVGETSAFGGALPVTGLAVDQQAALFAESCFQAGQAKCTYGTGAFIDRKSTRLNSSHVAISYAVFCLKKKKQKRKHITTKQTHV